MPTITPFARKITNFAPYYSTVRLRAATQSTKNAEMNKPRQIELLAPARNMEVAIEAIRHGADAVYMGAQKFGARAVAGNSLDDIRQVCDYAHTFSAKVYVTVNTILYDNELEQAQKLIWDLYYAGVDALIVQDMGILQMHLPPIALHASTQCDLRTPEKARFLESLGFTQLVLARELTLGEVEAIASAVKAPLEGFVHGALCVSYSGRCQASQAICGRSANRGECSQICRLKYDLTDSEGRVLVAGKHLLSLKDNNQSRNLRQLIDAGISSFKIEGRLKDASYVKNVVAYYRQALDDIIDADDSLERASAGRCTYTFTPQLDQSFNRGFTDYFVNGHPLPNGYKMAATDTPKSVGEPLGRVVRASGLQLAIGTSKAIANGDGLSLVNANGEMVGARVNRAEGAMVHLREPIGAKRGDMVYRTFNKLLADKLAKPSAQRLIWVDASLRQANGKLIAELKDERGNNVIHSIEHEATIANTPQEQRQREVMQKLGGTIYRLRHCTALDGQFIPASVLTRLRRETIELLDRAQLASRRRLLPGKRSDAHCHTASLGYADNVANHLAAATYAQCGATVAEPAMECWDGDKSPLGKVVMNTRYCIRRELGCCLRDAKAAHSLPRTLQLRCGRTVMQVACHCDKCEMELVLISK